MTPYSAWALCMGLCLAALVSPMIDTGEMVPWRHDTALAQSTEVYCGPGFHAQDGKCLPGFVAPKGPRPSTHGCPPGMAWSREEGCHEDD